jgi:hypothetical protein
MCKNQINLIYKDFRTCKNKQKSNWISNNKFKTENKKRKKEGRGLTLPGRSSPASAQRAAQQPSPRSRPTHQTPAHRTDSL